MKTLNKQALAMIALAVGAASVANSASACDLSDGGFLAAVVECAAPPLAPAARAADRLHGQMGRPLDRAVGTAINGMFQGSRTVPMMQPVMQPPLPVGMPMPMPQLGNFCHTPMGRFGPGPVNPVGAPCHIMTFQGPVMGSVGQ